MRGMEKQERKTEDKKTENVTFDDVSRDTLLHCIIKAMLMNMSSEHIKQTARGVYTTMLSLNTMFISDFFPVQLHGSCNV